MTAIVHNPSHCLKISGVFDFYGGRDTAQGPPAWPEENWTEAFALVRFPSRWPAEVHRSSTIPFNGPDPEFYSSQDEGWEVPYEEHRPGLPILSLVPAESTELCYVIRRSVQEMTLHDDELGSPSGWTEGGDAVWDAGDSVLRVAGSPSDPSEVVSLTKSISLSLSQPIDWYLTLPPLELDPEFLSDDRDHYLLKLKAFPAGYIWIRVTFYELKDGFLGTDEHVWINLASKEIGVKQALRAEYVSHLDEYWIRYAVTDPEDTRIEIRIVDDNFADDLTDPVVGDGVKIEYCTLQREEVPPIETVFAEEDLPAYAATRYITYVYGQEGFFGAGATGYDISLFNCEDNSRELVWRKFVPNAEGYWLTGKIEDHLDKEGDGTIVSTQFSSYIETIAPHRDTPGHGDSVFFRPTIASRGTYVGNTLIAGTCAVNDSQFVFYTGPGVGRGVVPPNFKPPTEGLVVVHASGETFHYGLANGHPHSNYWRYIEVLQHMLFPVQSLAPVGSCEVAEDVPYYYDHVGDGYGEVMIPRLAILCPRSFPHAIGFIPPAEHHFDDDNTCATQEFPIQEDPECPNLGQTVVSSHFWYTPKEVTDYCAITAGNVPRTGAEFGVPLEDLEEITGPCHCEGIPINGVTTITSLLQFFDLEDSVPVLQGPEGVLWDDEHTQERLLKFSRTNTITTCLILGGGAGTITGPDYCSGASYTQRYIIAGTDGLVACNPIMGDRAQGGDTFACLFSHLRADVTLLGEDLTWRSWEIQPPPSPACFFATEYDPAEPEEEVTETYWLTLCIGQPGEKGIGSANVQEEMEIFDDHDRYRICGLSAIPPTLGGSPSAGGYTYFIKIFDPDDPPRMESETYERGTMIAWEHRITDNEGNIVGKRRIPVASEPMDIQLPDCVASSRRFMALINWPDWELEDVSEIEDPLEIPLEGGSDFEDCELTINVSGFYQTEFVAVTIWVEHEDVGDLEVRLVPPSSSPITLAKEQGSGGQNFTATRFVQTADEKLPPDDDADPFTGDWLPQETGGFQSIAGNSAFGEWKVQILDHKNRSDPSPGQFLKWKLELGSQTANQWIVSHEIEDGLYKMRWKPSQEDFLSSRIFDPLAVPAQGSTIFDMNRQDIELSPHTATEEEEE